MRSSFTTPNAAFKATGIATTRGCSVGNDPVCAVGVNPADQRWPLWPLLSLSYLLQEQFRGTCPRVVPGSVGVWAERWVTNWGLNSLRLFQMWRISSVSLNI